MTVYPDNVNTKEERILYVMDAYGIKEEDSMLLRAVIDDIGPHEHGIGAIAKEREEQLDKHDRQIASDVAQNSSGELRQAAVALITDFGVGDISQLPLHWKDSICRHMAGKPYRERLALAGSFCAAEIDRIDFVESHKAE